MSVPKVCLGYPVREVSSGTIPAPSVPIVFGSLEAYDLKRIDMVPEETARDILSQWDSESQIDELFDMAKTRKVEVRFEPVDDDE